MQRPFRLMIDFQSLVVGYDCSEAGVTAVYSGHDHNNDYVGNLQGVRLAYG